MSLFSILPQISIFLLRERHSRKEYNKEFQDVLKRRSWEYQIIFFFTTTILESLVVPVIWLALIGATYPRIVPFFALNRIFFPANEEATLTTN